MRPTGKPRRRWETVLEGIVTEQIVTMDIRLMWLSTGTSKSDNEASDSTKGDIVLSRTQTILVIYNLTNDCTIILDTTITNNMLLHVSTFKMSSSGNSLCLTKITYRYLGLGKIKLLKYKMINFNKMLIVQGDKIFCVVAVYARCNRYRKY